MFQKFNRAVKDIKKIQLELRDMKNSLSEMKNTLGRTNGSSDTTKENISELEEWAVILSNETENGTWKKKLSYPEIIGKYVRVLHILV